MEQTIQPLASHAATGNMVKLVSGIARSLVDLPEEVFVEAVSSADGTVLRLQVAQGDVGKVIGKQGRTARSLRTIISAASMKLKHRFSLDIVEEQSSSTVP
ncbi:MAG: KH domain-containing protein [Janthinobacterium lividum]